MNCLTRAKNDLIFIKFQIFHLKVKNTNHLRKARREKRAKRMTHRHTKLRLNDYAN